ncbi:putative ComEC/Rec2-related protein [Sphingomonas changbaiensis NBRC 104936]|uniref:Putative ComEC/Rec2-related protein n=1 Tax=Sphingomonas changbaiensis NBRC 104936 TaxID=1219043 RepID=A0A0E9MKX5_9SPHN|nr:ComEC/Rec2 family competence protein [Sphingomonas changbaiensis]GAO38066.1 putative ComEC/Rec2-related protein [Sphingomonas changbaiensis NBRC 104936]
MPFAPRGRGWRLGSAVDRIEGWLEAERDQLPLWLPVMLGIGIAGWFVLPDRPSWTALIAAALGLALGGVAIGLARRAGFALLVGGLAIAGGCALAWAKAEWVAAPVLTRPVLAAFDADVERVQQLAAKDSVRVILCPVAAPTLPPRIRLNIANADAPAGLARGDRLRLRARLVPPPSASLPGGYDFAITAWFQQLGATGKAFAPVERLSAAPDGGSLRERIGKHIRDALPAKAAGIAVALVTGDQGAVSEADADAMRRSGLAHLLSVSGLHITAAVGAAMLLTLRLLALSPTLALRWPLMLIAAGVGAVTGIAYTFVSGAEIPTIRSCIAALLVLAGLVIGREALTLRLVAAGALVVLLIWPEALIGPSFQLSFAAVVAIIALHEHPRMRAFVAAREEGPLVRLGRNMAALLLSGIAVELALAPIALFHFHREGLYGALANIVAIPVTTFIVMPLEVLALLFDVVGLGAPFWWATGKAIALLLSIAHTAGHAPGAVALLPGVPRGAFALIVAGGLWICLWRTRLRWLGALPFAAGAVWALAMPAPDLLVTGDGRHLALRGGDGSYALLRPKAKDFVRGMLSEAAGIDEDLADLDDLPGAACTADICLATIRRAGREWRLLATRSAYLAPITAMNRACAAADIVVSDRRLPRTCRPHWLKLDLPMLTRTGGVSLVFGDAIRITNISGDEHPWTGRAVRRQLAR